MATRFARLLLLGCALAALPAHAEYADRPLRLIVPYPPGGGSDVLGRIVGPKLSEALRQPVVVENRPGAGANIGAQIAAKAPADGYTLFLGNVAHAINASVYPKLGYDLLKDFVPVTMLATTPNVLVVHPSVPATSVKELIALAKAQPGKLDYASFGSGSLAHLSGELLNSMAGIQLMHIPYNGGGPASIAVISGQTAVGFPTSPTALPQIKAGMLRALAVTNLQRSPSMPDLPTMSEAGVPGYEANNWLGMLVPAGTPPEIVTRLNAEIRKLLAVPETKEKLSGAGFEVATTSSEEFAAYLRSEVQRWGRIVKAVGARVD